MSLSRRLVAGGVALAAVGAVLVGVTTVGDATSVGDSAAASRQPIVIAHRGASEYRPEESASAYELAIEMGADYIEPDVVTTKDHVLIARHDNWLNDTTDVAQHPEFAALKTTKTIDGVQHNDWFTEDFTYAQLRTLRLKERLPDQRPRSAAFDGVDPIGVEATFDVIADARARGATILLSTHLRDLAIQACGTALVLRGGSRVAAVDAAEMAGEEGARAYRALLD